MKKRIASLALASAAAAQAQLSIGGLNSAVSINFESAVAGVNNGAFTAPANFGASPAAGGLDSDAWQINSAGTGAVNVLMGGSSTAANIGRGYAVGAASGGGVYSFETSGTLGTNHTLGFHGAGTGVNSPVWTLKITNNTGSTVTSLAVNFDAWFRDTATTSVSLLFAHNSALSATNNRGQAISGFTALGDTITSPSGTASNTWGSQSISRTIEGLSLVNGASYFLQWQFTSNNAAADDLMALDNISVTASAIPEPSAFAALAGLGGLAFAASRRRRR